MGTSKKGIKHTGPQGPGRFVILKGAKTSTKRARVARSINTLLGRKTTQNEAMFCFRQESDLGTFAARRVDVTVTKFMNAMAILFAEGVLNPHLHVEGATVQHGEGRKEQSSSGAGMVGFEAAHYGIGTLTRNGKSVSQSAESELRRLSAGLGMSLPRMRKDFQISAELIAMGLALDASTYYAPAFINRAEGLLEVKTQHYMKGLLPIAVPASSAGLPQAMSGLGMRVLNLLTKRKLSTDAILKRLTSIRQGTANEIVQDPTDRNNLLFGGQESQYLAALKAAFEQSDSELNRRLDRIGTDIPSVARELSEAAEAAREERLAANAS